MSSAQALYEQSVEHEALGGPDALVVGADIGVQTAGATYAELSFCLAVAVDEQVSLEQLGTQGIGSCHSGLLIYGHEQLHRSVLQVLGLEHRHSESHAYAVVRTKGGSRGLHPFSVYAGDDRVLLEVVLHVGVLLGYHIHVALEYHSHSVLVARGGLLAYDDIAHFVTYGLQSEGLAIIVEEFGNLLLVL